MDALKLKLLPEMRQDTTNVYELWLESDLDFMPIFSTELSESLLSGSDPNTTVSETPTFYVQYNFNDTCDASDKSWCIFFIDYPSLFFIHPEKEAGSKLIFYDI